MSSQSKRRAESEEVAHKKKPRKGGDEEDEFNQNEDSGLEVEHDKLDVLDEDNIIPGNKRTRGNRIDYTKVGGPDDDNGPESGEEMPKDKTGGPAAPRTRSTLTPQRVQKPPTDIENIEEDGDDDEEDEEYGGDDGGDEGEEGEYIDSDEEE